jgi:hypothetical protein
MTRQHVLILALVGVPVAAGDAYSYGSAGGRIPRGIAFGNGRLAHMRTNEPEAAAREEHG